MSTFQVPQFINQKPKIIGPLTPVQFGYFAGAAILSFLFYTLFTFTLWVFLTVILVVVASVFSFIRVSGQSFGSLIVYAFRYLWHPRLFTWQRTLPRQNIDVSKLEKIENLRRSMNFQNRLNGLKSKLTARRPVGGGKKEDYETVTYLTGEKKLAKKINYK